jgi:hypothetical protein
VSDVDDRRTRGSLPDVSPAGGLTAFGPLDELRGDARPSDGAAPAAWAGVAPEVRRELVSSGRPTGVATRDLVTAPVPARAALWRAVRSPAPLAWLTHRMVVVQWDEVIGRTSRRRTLLWCPDGDGRRSRVPRLAGVAERPLRVVHGSVLGHLRALGIDPADVDHLAFDHLQGRDLRHLLGTRRPVPQLGTVDAPLTPVLPNATLLVHRDEWETLRHPHPLQAPWYRAATFADLPADRIALLERDVLLGPGVAVIATPGRSPGHTTLLVHTDRGVWAISANGVAADSWSPRASRIPGLRRHAVATGQEVVLHATTLDSAPQHYDAMLLERAVADAASDAPFPQCLPSAELTSHRLAPGLRPTHVHGRIDHGLVRGNALPAHDRAA